MLFDVLFIGHVRSEPLRALLALLAITLGVAISLSVFAASRTADAAFGAGSVALYPGVNLQAFGVGTALDERALARVRYLPGVVRASPEVDGNAVVGEGNAREPISIRGVDLLQPLPVSGVQQRAPSPFDPYGAPVDLAAAIRDRGAFLSARLASGLGLRVGDTLSVLVDGKRAALRVARILPPDVVGDDSSNVFVDFSTAQALFSRAGRIDRIDFVVARDAPETQTRIEAALGPSAQVGVPSGEHTGAARSFDAVRVQLLVLAFAAFVVGAGFVYESIATSIVLRATEIGILRTLGATRGAIFRTFVCEGAIYGTFGALFGVVVGIGAAEYFAGPANGFVELGVFFAGALVATASAALAAVAAMRIQPAQAISSRGIESTAPSLLRSIVRTIGGVVADRVGPALTLALATFRSLPRRLAIAVAILAVASSVAVGLSVSGASVKSALDGWAAETFTGDLTVRAFRDGSGFSETVADAARHVRGVVAVSGTRNLITQYRRDPVTLHGDDAFAVPKSGPTPSPYDTQPASVTKALAARLRLHQNDVFPVASPTGPVMLRVVSVRPYDAGTVGAITVSRSVLESRFHDRRLDALALTVAAGADVLGVRADVARVVASSPVVVSTTRELRDQALGLIERSFRSIDAMAAMTLLLALIGIGSTATSFVDERRRQIALLRYVGATRGIVRAMVLSETFAYSLIGVGLGVVLGTCAAAVAADVAIVVPWLRIGVVVVASIGVALIAAVVPANRAARILAATAADMR